MIDLHKFVRALRLRWPWFKIERSGQGVDWFSAHPCNNTGMDFFYVAITIIIADGKIANFGASLGWGLGIKPKDTMLSKELENN